MSSNAASTRHSRKRISMGHSGQMRIPAALAMLVVVVAVLAGCSGGTPASQQPAVVAPRPVGVQDPAVVASASGGPAVACDPLASLRPSGSLPAPGAMPAGSTMAAIAARGRLVVGVDQNSYLFGYRDAGTGQIVGFDIDIARQVARAIFGDPNRIQLVAITSAQRIPYLQAGTVDMVARTMTMTCDRWRQVSFSSQYFDAGQRVLVPRTSTVKGIADLSGKKVCATVGSTSIRNIATAPSHPVPVAVNDWTDCLVMLQQGQVDAISTDDTILAGLAVQDPTTHLVGARFTSEPYGLAFPQKSADFVRFVNQVLAQMRADGTWSAIYTRWLGASAPAPPAARYQD
jgi:polar amino acid transport system substrate-binding protein